MSKEKIEFNAADEPYLLRLDMDWIPPKDWRRAYEHVIKHILQQWITGSVWVCQPLKVKSIETFESRQGLHWVIKLNKKLSSMQRLFLQFLLGDDRGRCKMNWRNIQLGMMDWNKLYTSYQYRRVKS